MTIINSDADEWHLRWLTGDENRKSFWVNVVPGWLQPNSLKWSLQDPLWWFRSDLSSCVPNYFSARLDNISLLFLNFFLISSAECNNILHVYILIFRMHKNTQANTAKRGSMWGMCFQYDPELWVLCIKKKAKWAVSLRGNILKEIGLLRRCCR